MLNIPAATMVFMLVTNSGVHIEQIGFESLYLFNQAMKQFTPEEPHFKESGWKVTIGCLRTGE